ncbi:Beta-1,3-galactosyltransferase [Dirofilaria immitis]
MNHSVAIKYGTVGDSLVPLFALPYHFTLMVNRFPLVDEEVHENNENLQSFGPISYKEYTKKYYLRYCSGSFYLLTENLAGTTSRTALRRSHCEFFGNLRLNDGIKGLKIINKKV